MSKDNQRKKSSLPADWFMKGRLDLEYKKYVLLAYLKQTEEAFNENKLYPHLSELVFHYRNLRQFIERKELFYNQFPEELVGVDLKKLKMHYRKVIQDDELMEKLEAIVNNSIEQMKPYLDEGVEIFEFIEQQIELKQVGLISINPKSGYLFVRNGDQKEMQVYAYNLKTFETESENYRGITTKYIASFKRSLTNTYEAIKKELVKSYQSFPNPGSYAIESRFVFPEKETLLPIAKRLLMRHLERVQE